MKSATVDAQTIKVPTNKLSAVVVKLPADR